MHPGPCPESRYTQEHSQQPRATSHYETSLCTQSEDVAGDRGLPHSGISSSAILSEGWKEVEILVVASHSCSAIRKDI